VSVSVRSSAAGGFAASHSDFVTSGVAIPAGGKTRRGCRKIVCSDSLQGERGWAPACRPQPVGVMR